MNGYIIVIALYSLVLILIGTIMSKKVKTTDDFFVVFKENRKATVDLNKQKRGTLTQAVFCTLSKFLVGNSRARIISSRH